MAKWIYAFASAMARPISFLLLSMLGIGASAAGFILDLGDGYSTIVNLSISLVTMIIGQAVLVSGSRGEMAMQLKFDEVIAALPDADNKAIGAEHEKAEVIERLKSEVEERNGNGK